jgi:D-methionine transport system permease protein
MSPDLLDLLARALWQTFVTVAAAGTVCVLAGLPLAILLTRTDREGFSPRPRLQRFRGGAGTASFLILLVALIPVSHLILGRSIGSLAAIIPLSIAATAYFARLSEAALNQMDRGLIDAGLAMGASRRQILLQFLLPEALPQIGAGFMVTLAAVAGASLVLQALSAGELALGDGHGLSHPAVIATAAASVIALLYFLRAPGSERSQHLGQGF